MKEVTPLTALPCPAETAPESLAKQLPVGNAVSSVHVHYDYFAVGTGQVNVTSVPFCSISLNSICFSVFFVS